MPRNPADKRIDLMLSGLQHAELTRISRQTRISLADIVRLALISAHPSIPDDYPPRRNRGAVPERTTENQSVGIYRESKQAPERTGTVRRFKHGESVVYKGFIWRVSALLDNGYTLKRKLGNREVSEFAPFDAVTPAEE